MAWVHFTGAERQVGDIHCLYIRLSGAGAQTICEAPKSGITFDRNSFAADPRIAKLRWVRA